MDDLDRGLYCPVGFPQTLGIAEMWVYWMGVIMFVLTTTSTMCVWRSLNRILPRKIIALEASLKVWTDLILTIYVMNCAIQYFQVDGCYSFWIIIPLVSNSGLYILELLLDLNALYWSAYRSFHSSDYDEALHEALERLHGWSVLLVHYIFMFLALFPMMLAAFNIIVCEKCQAENNGYTGVLNATVVINLIVYFSAVIARHVFLKKHIPGYQFQLCLEVTCIFMNYRNSSDRPMHGPIWGGCCYTIVRLAMMVTGFNAIILSNVTGTQGETILATLLLASELLRTFVPWYFRVDPACNADQVEDRGGDLVEYEF
jgi:hypothetical protein